MLGYHLQTELTPGGLINVWQRLLSRVFPSHVPNFGARFCGRGCTMHLLVGPFDSAEGAKRLARRIDVMLSAILQGGHKMSVRSLTTALALAGGLVLLGAASPVWAVDSDGDGVDD
ncbi:MAG: hypothetical protein ACE5GE_05745, partial [Phycisphaerae bacterium]